MIKWLLWQLYALNSSAAICDIRFARLVAFKEKLRFSVYVRELHLFYCHCQIFTMAVKSLGAKILRWAKKP